MRVLELRVPPLALVLITGCLMALGASAVPAASIAIPAQQLFIFSFALLGTVASTSGVLAFRRSGTTVNPLQPDRSSSLVASGIYTLSRNPMYLGFLMLLTAWGIYLSNAVALVFLPVFILYMNRFQIEPEERALTSRFGQEFVEYTRRVRRWL